jgi:hypothetical protein
MIRRSGDGDSAGQPFCDLAIEQKLSAFLKQDVRRTTDRETPPVGLGDPHWMLGGNASLYRDKPFMPCGVFYHNHRDDFVSCAVSYQAPSRVPRLKLQNTVAAAGRSFYP